VCVNSFSRPAANNFTLMTMKTIKALSAPLAFAHLSGAVRVDQVENVAEEKWHRKLANYYIVYVAIFSSIFFSKFT